MNKFLQTTLLIALTVCTSYVSGFAQQRKVALLDLTTRNAEETHHVTALCNGCLTLPV